MRLKSVGLKWTQMQMVGERLPARVLAPVPSDATQPWLLPVLGGKAATANPGPQQAF